MKYGIYLSLLLVFSSLHAMHKAVRELTGGKGAHANTVRAANLRHAIKKDSEKVARQAARIAVENAVDAVNKSGHERKRSLSNNDLTKEIDPVDRLELRFNAALEALVAHVQKKKNVDIMRLVMALQKAAVEWGAEHAHSLSQNSQLSRQASVRTDLMDAMQSSAGKQESVDPQLLRRIERLLKDVHHHVVPASLSQQASGAALPAPIVPVESALLPPPPPLDNAD